MTRTDSSTGPEFFTFYASDGAERITWTDTRFGMDIEAGHGNDTITTGDGNDRITNPEGGSPPGHDRMNSGDGSDFIVGGSGSDTIVAWPDGGVAAGIVKKPVTFEWRALLS